MKQQSSSTDVDAKIWQDVCLASAWSHRAQNLHSGSIGSGCNRSNNSEQDVGEDGIAIVISAAERALSLYQSCHKSLRRKGISRDTNLDALQKNESNYDSGRAFTINLELRMAQTLRFLALVHATSSPSSVGSTSDSNGSGENNGDSSSKLLESAIKYHDMAVSLLVGVFDEDEEEEEDDDNNDQAYNMHQDSTGSSNQNTVQQLQQKHQQVEGEMDIWSTESFSEQSADEGDALLYNNFGQGGRIVHTIHIPTNDSVASYYNNQNAQPNTLIQSTTNNNSASEATTPCISRANFTSPTEDQRVRAISVSLNALAELHARNGNDRAAMDSYREALEILRAATEEEEDDEVGGLMESDDEFASGDGGGKLNIEEGEGVDVSSPRQRLSKKSSSLSNSARKNKNSSLSPITEDLANTLMNVGNFHLRRDELDAAFNAFTTVWALYSGNSLDDQHNGGESVSHVPTPSTPSNSSIAGSATISGVSLPYLTPSTPQQQRQQYAISKSLSQSSYNTPNTDATSNNPSSSAGALVALTNLGIIHERRSQFNEALSCFEYVHHTRMQIRGEEYDDTINSLLNIGNVHQRMGEFENAGRAYEECVRLYKRKLARWNNMTGMGDEYVGSNTRDAMVKLYRSLAGALRNWGTCSWKQRRIPQSIDRLVEAVEAEERIVTLLCTNGPASTSGTRDDNVRQAKESMAQLLGLLGCLYLEYKLDELKSYDKSEGAFQRAIGLYRQFGYDESHPSVAWARHNLMIVEQSRAQPRAPPPPPSSAQLVARPAALEACSGAEDDNTVDMDDIDSVELDQVLETGEDDADDDIFSGVFENNSTDELDEFLSQPLRVKAADGEGGKEVVASAEEVDFDDDALSNAQHNMAKEKAQVTEVTAIKPLSNMPRNISSSSLLQGDGEQGAQYSHDDDDIEERLSQLQLQTESDEGYSLEAAQAHVQLAEHFRENGDRESATDHLTEAHSIYITRLGDSNAEVANCLKKLGDLNFEDDALVAAKELYGEALEMELAVHGQYLAQTLNAAGAVCLEQDDFRSAMEFHRRALQIQKKSQGGGDGQNKYDMYETLVRIGNVYYSERNNLTNIQSNRVDYREFIESGFLGWIANAHDMRGEYIKAIQFYEESLQIYMSRKGKEARRETALTLNRLGSLTRELGRYDEAMDYHQRALNIQKAGSPKAMTAETCVLMGMVKSKTSEYKSALDLYEDSLLVLKNSLGEEHLSVSKTMTQIGLVHLDLSNYEEAISILQEAERSQLASVGENNRDTLETQALVGRVLLVTGDHEKALEKLSIVLERQGALFGSSHPAVADTLSYIGECYLDQEKATEARSKFVECYRMRKQFCTVDQICIAESMVDVIRARQGQPERALAIYRNAMEVYKEYLPDDHVLLGRLHVYMGDSHSELLNFTTAIEQYEKAENIFHRVFDDESTIDSALVSVNVGRVLLRKCDYDAAKISFTSALTIYQQILPEGHEKITRTLGYFDRVEQEEALCV